MPDQQKSGSATEDWNFYLCNVNGAPASIFLNLALHRVAPDRSRPILLWLSIHLRWPHENGLSDTSELGPLSAIEEMLSEVMRDRFDAIYCGRITTEGRREFYFYGSHSDGLDSAVEVAAERSRSYQFESGFKEDKSWKLYSEVLYPSDEDGQRIKSRKVLDLLQERHDTLRRPRDVLHWIYFRSEADRMNFQKAVMALQYRVQSTSVNEDYDFPFALCIVRFQSVSPEEIDDAVIELFRLARDHGANYDGWETEVISAPD